MDQDQHIAVIGAGIMGHGIAQVGAMAGLFVTLMDNSDAALDRATEQIQTSLAKLASKGRLDSTPQEICGRIRRTGRLAEAVKSADFVIEAVPEIVELKRSIFVELDRLAPAHALLATNTSQYSITELASVTGRPAQVVGMHWFSPAVLMKLVEVVRGLETADATVERTTGLARRLDKEPIVCTKDSPGFITTRLIAVLTNEAQRIVEEGLASVDDVDRACRLAFGHPMGPFQTADLTGLDTQLRVRQALSESLGERFRPTNLLRTLVAA